MKSLKHNAILFFLGVAFSLFAGLNTFAFVQNLQEHSEKAYDASSITSDFSEVPFAEILSNRLPLEQSFSRNPHIGDFQGFSGNGSARSIRFGEAFFKINFLHLGTAIPSSRLYGLPKDYYVFTLGRILC